MKKISFIVLLVLASCNTNKTEFKNLKELESYVNEPENGFIVSEESADFIFEAKLTPAFKDDKVPQITIQLRIKRKDGGATLDYNGVSKEEALNREGYLSFDVSNDVHLESAVDENFPAVFHHYERNYGLKPSIDLFFRFLHFEPTEDVYLVYRDELFGQGLIRIKFSKELFNKCYVEST